MRYAVVLAETPSGYSAHVPDLPGCIATGPTLEETIRMIQEAIEGHIELMRERGYPIPKPSTEARYVEVHVAA